MDRWYLEHLYWQCIFTLRDMEVITGKPRFTRQEAEDILKKCDEIEGSVQRLREAAKQVLKSTAKVVPIRGKFP